MKKTFSSRRIRIVNVNSQLYDISHFPIPVWRTHFYNLCLVDRYLKLVFSRFFWLLLTHKFIYSYSLFGIDKKHETCKVYVKKGCCLQLIQLWEIESLGLTSSEKNKFIPEKTGSKPKFNPLVSVVLPTYNRARLLRRAVKSVLDQTYPNFELIVVDDCSTDGTEGVVKGFQDDRIRYIRHEKNQGAPITRNTGIRAAKGKYIAFQDSDDVWYSTKLEKQVNAFNSAPIDLGVIYTSFWLIDNDKETMVPSSLVKHTEGKIHNALLAMNFVSLSSAIVKKECFVNVGMFENIPRFQDWELWLRISKYYSFKHLREPLVKVYRQSDSISRNTDVLISARKYILSKYYYELSKNSKLLSKHYSDIGIFLCSKGDIKEGREYFFKALSVHPFNARLLLWTIVSIFGSTTYNKYSTFYETLKTSRNLKHKNLEH